MLDNLQHLSGVEQPSTDYKKLADDKVRLAFADVIENMYRHAQAYGNLAIAITVHLVVYRCFGGVPLSANWWMFGSELIVIFILLIGHRQMLASTYMSMQELLGSDES